MNSLLVLIGLVQGQLTDSAFYSGAQRLLKVSAPRVEAPTHVDGVLDEPVWTQAARLTDFSQYSPADGQPAQERTEILVWYSPTAIHFGVRAYAEPGSVRAHLTDRDRGIITDDYVEIQLGTFNDGRQAFVFAVNPLGVQADGALVEGSKQRFPGYEDNRGGREQADLNPDFTFDSKGRLTEFGYEVEVRIPFRSLRYQTAERQDWSLQVVRKAAASGREDTWAPARRAAASFVAQGGTLVGLEGLRRGLVLEMNPFVTSTVNGAALQSRWDYGGGSPEVGGNLKWGITTNLNLNGTFNPDFSQVESDAGQVSSDPRRAIFFAEKRPFFLDGLEYFSTPSQVIYTRRIGAPIGAVKLTGKVSGTSFGFLSAVDGSETSATGLDHPVHNVLRVQRDVGGQSRLGLAYTDKIDGRDYNRVGQLDGRLVLSPLYSFSFYAALSRTRSDATVSTAPMWSASLAHTGRTFGFQASFQGVSDQFQAGSGFIGQGDLVEGSITPSITLYGRRGAFVERFSGSFFADLVWPYTTFRTGGPALDRRLMPRVSWTIRGGWDIGVSGYRFNYGYDERLFRSYALEVPTPQGRDTIPYPAAQRIPSLAVSVTVHSPEVGGFLLETYLAFGRDVNYIEWSAADIWLGRLALSYRPTQKLRFESGLPMAIYHRASDGTRVASTLIPRLKVEYQISRAVFLRLVGEYRSDQRDDLRDDTRTNYPILIRDASGVYRRDLALALERNDFRVDFLFSFQPTPGTVFFAGYGSSLTEDEAFRFRGLSRVRDNFFTKLSYLFRL